MSLRYITFTLIGFATIALTGCGGGHKDVKVPNTVRVTTMVCGDTSVTSVNSYSGTIQAGSTATAAFTIPGTIRSISVDVGQRVSKGQLIATVDDASLRSTYQGALATLEEAQDVYKRMELLHNRKALADVKWVEVQAKLKQAEAMASVARTALNDARLYAPISGVVSRKVAEIGETALPAMPIVEIMTQGTPKAEISVPENQISTVTIGQTATVACSPLGQRRFQARVSEKGVAADPMTRGYTVKLTILNPSDSLRPGMICSVALDNVPQAISEAPAVISVPASCVVLTDDNRNIVWLDRSGRAHKQYVRIADITDQGVVIDSGLTVGDTVIIAGQDKVSQGTFVTPVK